MSEKHFDVSERLQTIGETVTAYKDALARHFKEMDVEVKDWHFSVGKVENEYIVEVNVKLGVKPKEARATE